MLSTNLKQGGGTWKFTSKASNESARPSVLEELTRFVKKYVYMIKTWNLVTKS